MLVAIICNEHSGTVRKSLLPEVVPLVDRVVVGVACVMLFDFGVAFVLLVSACK